ncbi:MAG: MFS transporter [Sphingomonadales bacterium]|uniref:MFS transporter n=1 Tax=Novosphingobium sp. NDB2Meth1 TaxID=1892847 RepID=UPI000931A607|nr:MFS transporter [Novosphingobium sp. NDB2Meth1]MBU6394452.1 MFS transporter [Sphingomonadales bacterium]
MAAIGATAAPAGEENASVALRWYVLFIMMLAYTINIADRYVMSTVLEQIRLDLHLSDGGVAFLTGVSLALFYVSMGIPLSWIADRYNRRNLLAISITLWSLMTTLCGLSRGYIELLLARMGVGIGEAGGTPSCNSIICDYFPAARRPMALTIFCLGAPIGAWIGADMAGAVANAYGWRAAFLVLGVPGLLLALLIMATIREPKRGCLDVIKSDDDPTLMDTLRFCMSQKSAVHVMMGSGVGALWGWGLMWFIPTFLQRTYQIDVGQAGAIVGPIHLVMGIGASLLTAWILARPSYTDPRKIVYLLGGVTAVATVPGIIAIYTHNLTLATVSLWLFIPGIYFYIGPAFALGQNLAPPKMRAMFSAIALLIANVFNLIVAPQGVGMLSDWFAGPAGPDANSLRSALLILAPTGFWAALHYFLAARTIVEDQQRAIGHV